MKTYTIIGGVNGTGKSSLTGVLRSELDNMGRIVDVDKITAALGGDKLKGGKEAIARIEECIHMGVCFTQETTLSGRRTALTARRAVEAGYYVRLYYVGLDSMQDSIDRIRNRVLHGGHDIPSEDVRRRFHSRFEDVKRVLPYCNEATFFDNGNGFVMVAEYRNGELMLKGHPLPAWILSLQEALQ